MPWSQSACRLTGVPDFDSPEVEVGAAASVDDALELARAWLMTLLERESQ